MSVRDRAVTERSGDQEILTTAKGSGFLAGGSMFEYAVRFAIALLLANGLGAADYGLYALAVSAGALFAGVALIGLDDAMVRYVAIQSDREDDAGVWGTIQIGLGASTLAAVAVAGFLFVSAPFVAVTIFHEPRLVSLLRIVAVLLPFLTVSNVLAGIARGFKRMDYVAYAENAVMSLVRLAGIAILTLVGSLNVYRAVWVFGISDVAASVALLILVNRRFRLRRPLNRDVRRDARPVFRFAFPLWLSSLVRQFRRNIETMLLGALTTVSSVGIFAVAARVNLVGHVTLLALLVAVKPVLAQLHARGDRRSLGAVYTTSTRWAYALNLPFFVVIVLYAEPLLRIFGPSFTAGATALVVFAVSELVNAGTGTCGSLLDMTGHTRTKLANSIIWTVLLIGGGALLIPAWGVLGAAVSTLIAVGSVNGLTVLEVWMLERLQPFDRSFWKPTFAAVAAAIVGLVIRQLVSPGDRFVIAAAQAVLVVVVYIGLVLAIGLAPEDRLVLERTARKLRLPWWRPMVTETTGRRA